MIRSSAKPLLGLTAAFCLGLTLMLTVVAAQSNSIDESERRDFEKHGGIVYQRGEDYELKCDVYVPEGDGPFPGVLAVHGGGWRGGSKVNLSWHARRLARAGFVVVAINYRHAPKYKFPCQIHDCKAAVRWMRKHADRYKIDPDRIAGFGYSAGGHLVSLLGTTDSDDGLEGLPDGDNAKTSTRLQAVVAGGAPCDFSWVSDRSQVLAYWLGSSPAEDPEIYRQAAPITYVTDDDPPFLLYHGSHDLIVTSQLAQNMSQQLERAGVECDLHILEDYGHVTTFTEMETVDRAVEFLNRVLPRRERPSSR